MKKIVLFSLALSSMLFFSCEDDNGKTARVEVWLTDAPGDFQEVNVDVQGVEIHTSEAEAENGWQSLDVTPKVYNLLNLTNGNEAFLGDVELPGGKISQIRMKLGDENSVKVDNVTYPLKTPSGQQSGLKLQVHQVLTEGITYKILLDFEAAKSVVENGAGDYILKPVIRAITEAQSGAIKGVVDPAVIAEITVVAADTTFTNTFSDEQGEFLVRGVPEGTYKLVFNAPGDDPDVVKEDVTVTTGQVTDVGVVDVEP